MMGYTMVTGDGKVNMAFQDQGHSRFPAFPLPDPAAQSRM